MDAFAIINLIRILLGLIMTAMANAYSLIAQSEFLKYLFELTVSNAY